MTALGELEVRGRVILDHDFVDSPDRTTDVVRIPAGNSSVRKVNQVPPSERRLAMRKLAHESPGMSADELIEQTARLFGWRRRGSDIESTLRNDLRDLNRGDEHTS